MSGQETLDVFVSYKREDRQRVEPLVESLRGAGLSVWWDTEIPGGSGWRTEIQRHLERAKCLIVVWSEASVSAAGEFVHDEAGYAKQRGILLPVSIDAVSPPLGFGQIQSLDLTGWTGDPHDVRVMNVITAARAHIAGGPLPVPAAPTRRPWRIAAAVAFAISTIGFLADIASFQSAICAIRGIRSACALVGVGGVPTPAAEREWAARPAGNCDWLRAYVSKNPHGAYADQVARLLQARREAVEQTWQPEEHRLRIHVASRLDPFPGERDAQADTLTRAPEEANQACSSFASETYRFRASRADEASFQWQCRRTSEGTRCSLDAQAVCGVDARHSVIHEVCD